MENSRDRRRKRLQAEGLCVSCGAEPVVPGRKWYGTKCQQARSDKHMEHWHQRKAAGLCVYCGVATPVEGKLPCSPCLKAHNDRSQKSKDIVRQEMLNRYGQVCACCKEARQEFLALDHIDGSGAQQRREHPSRTGSALYSYPRKQGWPAGFRVLCHNCNFSLGAHGYCPHANERNPLP